MSPLYMLELQIDVAALHKFLHIQGYAGREDETELGYGIHAWLKAAFSEIAPKPWRLLMDGKRPTRILGYSAYHAQALQQRLHEFGEPSVAMVCPESLGIAGRQMPNWQTGRKLGFQVLACPVGRKAVNGVEKDLFLITADAVERGTRISREVVYGEWMKKKFAQYGVAIEKVDLTAFRLVKQIRQTQSLGDKRRQKHITRPQALLEGHLTVGDPQRFTELLAHGLGRHRAFGYGMVLLRPIQ